MAPNERQMRIEVGLKLEQVVTNDFAAAVIQTDMLLRFREGDYAAGINAGMAKLIERRLTR